MNNKSKNHNNTKIFRSSSFIISLVLLLLVSSIFVFSLVSLLHLTGLTNHIEFLSEPIMSSGDHSGAVPISVPPTIPDGSTYCGSCTGCGEYHFIWDNDYDDHEHYDDYIECDH